MARAASVAGSLVWVPLPLPSCVLLTLLAGGACTTVQHMSRACSSLVSPCRPDRPLPASQVQLVLGPRSSPGVQEAAALGAPGLAQLLTRVEGAAQLEAVQLLAALAGDSRADDRPRHQYVGLTLAETGAVPVLVGLIGSRSLATGETAVQLLHAVSSIQPQRVAAAGGIPALVCLLLRTYTTAKRSWGERCLAGKVAGVLRLLAERSPPNCAAIAAAGAVPALEHMVAADVYGASQLLQELQRPLPPLKSESSRPAVNGRWVSLGGGVKNA